MRDAILVLRLSSLGDVVLTSSFLRSQRDHFPHAAVTFVVRDDLAELATALPGVDRIVAVRRDTGFFGLQALAADLARTAWAHVFDLHQSARSRLLTARLWKRTRAGFHKQSLARWLLVHAKRDAYARLGGTQPLRERMLEPLRALGLPVRVHDTQLILPDAARAAADAALAAAGLGPGAEFVAIAPGARWASKRWPLERFAALAARLTEGGARVVVVGGREEHDLAAAVAAAAPPASVSVAGRLGLLETAAVLERSTLVISNDSGLAHVGEAVGRPVVVLFGATSPRFGYAPYRAASRTLYDPPPCSPCSKNGSRPCSQPTHVCMLRLEVGAVESAVEAALAPRS